MVNTSILDMDATTLANSIQNQEITSVEATTTYIEQIKKVNPYINAMVESRFDEALMEAKEMDELLRSGQIIGPLHGVPLSVKEAFHVVNMKTTGGLVHRQDLISRQDAHVVKLVKDAGAIILGKTNTPTLCFSQETENKLYGRTNNPWDLSKTSGGSSGGEGALLATGASTLGIASDIGGSIRIPAHFNGVIGFKPGMKQIMAEGHFPKTTTDLQERMFSIGTMGKSVRDMRLMYQILSGNYLHNKSLRKFKIEILPSTMDYPLSDPTIDLLDEIELYLGKTFSIKRTVPPYFEESARLWQEILSSGDSSVLEKGAYNNDRSRLMKGFIREKLTEKTTIHPFLSRSILASKIFKPSAKRLKEIREIITQGDQRLHHYLENRLLVFPVYYTSAPRHGKVYQEIFSIRKSFLKYMPYVAYANVWGLPSLSIPVGEDQHHLPISIQIMSINGNEDAILKLGRIIEKRFRGFKRCRKYD